METPRTDRRTSARRLAEVRRRHLIILIAAVVLTYLSALPGGFVWTDQRDILEGGQRILDVQDLERVWTLTTPQYRSRVDGPVTAPPEGTWQPITTLDYSIGWALWGDCAFCYRFENLVWHVLVVIGLYALGRHLLSQRRHGNAVAFWAAMAFAVHPAGVTAVAWIGGRPTLLSAALAIWALVFFTRLPATSKSRRHHIYRWLGGLSLLAVGAGGAFEFALVVPLVALIIAWYESVERGRPGLTGISRSRRFGLLALLLAALAIVVYRLGVFGGLNVGGSWPSESALDNVGTALRLYWHYVERVLLPGEPIASDAWRITQQWGTAEFASLLGLLLWVAATAVGLYFRQPAAVGSAWFLLWLLPSAGWFPAEHYHTEQALYPAAWGLVFGLAHLLMLLWRPVGRQLMRGSEALMYAPIVLVLAFVTALSNVRFWSDAALFESEVAADPRYIEGRVMLARRALAEDRAAEAMNHALNAVDAARDKSFTGYYPRYEVYYLLGQSQLAMNLYAEAQGSFETALEERPGSARALHGLGLALIGQGDYATAERKLRESLAGRSEYAAAKADLGVALVGLGRYDEGIALLESEAADRARSSAQEAALADAYIASDRWERAREALEAALRRKETAGERAKLAWVIWQQGDLRKAREHIHMALQLEEQSSEYVLSVYRQLEEAAEPPESPAGSATE